MVFIQSKCNIHLGDKSVLLFYYASLCALYADTVRWWVVYCALPLFVPLRVSSRLQTTPLHSSQLSTTNHSVLHAQKCVRPHCLALINWIASLISIKLLRCTLLPSGPTSRLRDHMGNFAAAMPSYGLPWAGTRAQPLLPGAKISPEWLLVHGCQVTG